MIRVFIVGFNSITKFQYALFFNKILQYPQRFIRKHRILKFLNVVKPNNKYWWTQYYIRNIGFKWFFKHLRCFEIAESTLFCLLTDQDSYWPDSIRTYSDQKIALVQMLKSYLFIHKINPLIWRDIQTLYFQKEKVQNDQDREQFKKQ